MSFVGSMLKLGKLLSFAFAQIKSALINFVPARFSSVGFVVTA